jgi:SAM-dependent methyltransferase
MTDSTDRTSAERRAAAAYWDRPAPVQKRARWWAWPRIVAHQNALICGEPLAAWGAGLVREIDRRWPGRRFRRAVSIACGNGAKELELLRSGLVEYFDLYEISEARIRHGQKLLAKAGLSDRVAWHTQDGVAALELGPRYDLVTWDNGLHHMADTARAVAASVTALRPGGVFLMNDYVGPNRFQWGQRTLAYATAVRHRLPEALLRDPADPSRRLPVTISRPDREAMIALDPSEAAASEDILPAIRRHFPEARIWMLGGAIYHLALNDVLANFDPARDAPLLESLLLLDLALAELGESQYAACLAAVP